MSKPITRAKLILAITEIKTLRDAARCSLMVARCRDISEYDRFQYLIWVELNAMRAETNARLRAIEARLGLLKPKIRPARMPSRAKH